MAKVLKLPQFLQCDGEAKMNIGRGRIDAELDVERPAESQFLQQFGFANDLRRAAFEQFERGFGGLHRKGPDNETSTRLRARFLRRVVRIAERIARLSS